MLFGYFSPAALALEYLGISAVSDDRWVSAVVFGLVLSLYGFWKGSLDKSGAIAGFLVGFIHVASSLRFTAALLVFFFTSSKLTKIGADVKKKVEDEYKEGGQRDWMQVVANGGYSTILCIKYLYEDVHNEHLLNAKLYPREAAVILAILGHYACVNADTWSSELGVLATSPPRLILPPFRVVPRGTNGGVTIQGYVASFLGGAVIGLSIFLAPFAFCDGHCTTSAILSRWALVPLGAFAGVLGSTIDSLLGATLQYSGVRKTTKKVVERPGRNVTHISGVDFLDNHSVNLLAGVVTSMLVQGLVDYDFVSTLFS